MTELGSTPMEKLLAALKDKAMLIRDLESKAKQALEVDDDIKTYKYYLEQKTGLLMDLPRDLGPMVEEIDDPFGSEIARSLEDFASRARNAKSVDSVFYMSSLLYPEDYTEGEPNDLEAFIAWLRDEAGESIP
jgi:hypothetical protein